MEIGDSSCANGGIKIEILVDGAVDESQTQYVCHGAGAHENTIGTIAAINIPAGTLTSAGVAIEAFKMARTPTTVAQFKACVDAGACTVDNYYTVASSLYCNYNRGDAWLDHPMNCVNWHGANEYCAWIGGRLPTEHEWQYAATHNGVEATETTYAWGNDAPTHCGHANYYDSATSMHCNGLTEVSSFVGTAPVGMYSPKGDSPLGLQDITGNVWEWTGTLYSATSSTYILKGGSWDNYVSDLPVSVHINGTPTGGNNYNGFRCVADVD